MTLQGAHDTARNAAERFGKPFRVWRMAAWPPDVYGATAIELPREAEILATYPDDGSGFSRTPAAADDVQGSLF